MSSAMEPDSVMVCQEPTDLERKVLGSLAAAVVGDSLGAPTEQRSIHEIEELWGAAVTEFKEPPADSPYAKGRKSGQITDDSSQMLMLARVLVRTKGQLSAEDMAAMLLEWSENPEYYPHFAGPSTRRAVEALRAGADPNLLGAQGRETTIGTSNGGAMRVAPVGLIYPGNPRKAVELAAITCRPSHFTNIGVAGAGAIAAAVSVAVSPDSSLIDVVRASVFGARYGAEIGATEGRECAGPSVEERIKLAVGVAGTSSSIQDSIRKISSVVGTGLHAAEAVPAAIGFFVAAGGDPWEAVFGAANAGDDSDTVACMAGALAGAFSGIEHVPADKLRQVEEANDIDLRTLAVELAALAEKN